MTGKVLSGALVAGLAAGFLAAVLNLWVLTPLILEAETFEAAAAPHEHAEGAADDHGHAHAHAPAGGLGARSLQTVAMTLVTYAGFGLLLGAAMAAGARDGRRIDARTGLLWGLGGFAAAHLAPAVGLPPELPGMASADLGARQVWWVACVAATGVGLALVAFGRGAAWVAGGVALILAPHLLGAPQPPEPGGVVPASLAADFATRSLGVAALTWAALGALAGWLAGRPAARPV